MILGFLSNLVWLCVVARAAEPSPPKPPLTQTGDKFMDEISMVLTSSPDALTSLKIPAIIRFENGNRFETWIYLTFSPVPRGCIARVDGEHRHGTIPADMIYLESNANTGQSLSIPVQISVPPLEDVVYWSNPMITLSISQNSFFSTMVGSFLLSRNDRPDLISGDFVINPRYPRSFARDRLFYTSRLIGENGFIVAGDVWFAIRGESRPTKSSLAARVDPLLTLISIDPSSPWTCLPLPMFREFLQLLSNFGSVSRIMKSGRWSYEFELRSHVVLEQLPKLNFAIQLMDDSEYMLELGPSEYLFSTGSFSKHRIMIFARRPGSDEILLGSDVLENSALWFDPTNKFVSFGVSE